jgi:hypothetical protein
MINNLQNSAFFSAFSPYMTPCPNVFQYQHSSSGEWYGVISIPNPYPILAIEIKVEMYITGTVSLVIHLDTFSILECNALSLRLSWLSLLTTDVIKGGPFAICPRNSSYTCCQLSTACHGYA